MLQVIEMYTLLHMCCANGFLSLVVVATSAL